MNIQLFDFLKLLDFGDDNILFQQQEGEHSRTSFEMEKEALSFVAAGDPDAMVAHYRGILESNPKTKFSIGRLSKDELQHFKYMAVSVIAIVCRVAMSNGAPEAVAYSMSDEAIQKIDKMKIPENILLYLAKLVYSYTELVGSSKQNIEYSKPIRDGIEYIIANLHTKITLDDLVQGTHYNKDYYAKLFKKEVGQTLTDYILDLRIQEAKKMIIDGKSSREIAYTFQFSSQSYFIQQFKKATGMTPREYKLLRYTRPNTLMP